VIDQQNNVLKLGDASGYALLAELRLAASHRDPFVAVVGHPSTLMALEQLRQIAPMDVQPSLDQRRNFPVE
jgi:hypothetical protein